MWKCASQNGAVSRLPPASTTSFAGASRPGATSATLQPCTATDMFARPSGSVAFLMRRSSMRVMLAQEGMGGQVRNPCRARRKEPSHTPTHCHSKHLESLMMSRRDTLKGLGAFGAAFAGVRTLFGTTAAHAARTYEVTLSEADWKKRLNPQQFDVLR